MNTLQKIFLLLILSFIVKAGFAQCAVGETEVTIHFTKEGQDRFGVRWDFRTANGLSGNGPYASYDSITTCVPYGELTILACNYYDNSWNNAVLEIISTEDGTVNNCSQDGCLIYKSTSIEIADIPNCNFNHPEFELITLDISSCNELIHGCTNPNSFNYNVCADIDDGSCLLPTENNNCINAEMIEVGDFGNCFSYNVTLPNLEYNTFESQEESDFADAYYKFVVPSAGQIRFITNKYSLEAALFEDCNKNTFWLSYDYSNYDELGIIKNLPPGDTLILQVKDSSFGEDFRFCIEEVLPTDNDKFEQAEYIEINKPDECAWVEVNIASNTLYLEPECDGYAYYPYSDAYYKTVVPENGQISFSTEYSYGVGLSIYDHCEKNVLYCGFKSQVPTIKNLTPGDTIILQIISTGRANNQIKFCFTEAPISPNDLCQNAVPLIVYDAGIYSESPQSIVEDFIHTAVDLTHNNLHLVPECFENAESDAFFSFVVPASGQVKIQSTHYIGFALYEYCDEPSIYCANFERYTHKSVIKNLTPGQTLLLQCWRGGYSDKFSISISDAIPSFNNNCTDAKELFVHPHGSCGNNNSYQFRVDVPIENNSIDLLPACSQNVKADVFYKAIVPESGNIKVYTTFVAGLAVYNNCQQAPSYCESDMTKEFLVENLAPGEEVILQFFQDYYPKDFQACIQDYTPPLPPTNNDCSNPLAINLQDLCNEKKLISGKNNNLSITPSCNPDAKADMFYQLSVPESGSIQTIINNKAGVYISGYSLAIYDECNGNEIVCLPNLTNKGVINGLPAGNTVILQIIMETPYDFSLCLKDATPSPNDYCDQAQLIEVNDCLSNINMIDLSFDSGDDNISCSYDRVDVYYKFVVPKNGEIQLTVLKSNAGVGAAIFSACGGEELFCDQSWHNGNISDLPLGETVLLQLSQSNYSKEVFSFCLGKVAPSFNDICANAETVEVSTKGNCEYNLTPFSGFANTAAKLPSCFNGTIHEIVDSYYEFIVPPSGTIKINGGDTGSYWPIQNYAIYESCNGEELHCNYDNHPRKSIGNLPPGEKVILQVFQNEQYSVNFFCIEEVLPTVNSDCSNAELLNISNGWECSSSNNADATFANIENNPLSLKNECNQDATADIFYKFVVPPSGNVELIIDYDVEYSLYKSCVEEPFFCYDYIRDEVIVGLTPDDTILMQFYQSKPDNFYVCIKDAPVSINNSCNNAEYIELREFGDLTENHYEYAFVAFNRNNTLQIQPSCNLNALADCFFEFEAPVSGQISIHTGYSKGIAVYESCNGVEIYCGSTDAKIRNLTPGKLYILQFYQDFMPTNFEFTIEKSPDTANNLCENAKSIPILRPEECIDTLVTLHLENYTSSLKPPCINYDPYDAFYKIIVPGSGSFFLPELTRLAGVALYESCSGENLFCGIIDEPLLFENLNAGDTIIMQIYNDIVEVINFCLSEPIENDNCSAATALTAEVQSGALYSASISEIDYERSCNLSNYNKSVWYTFDTDDTGDPISIQLARTECNTYGNKRIGISILKGDCETGFEEIACSSIINSQYSTSVYISNPEKNITYYIQIAGESESTNCNFEISAPVKVQSNAIQGCTDQSACNYNELAVIDDGSCEYLSCQTIFNPIEISIKNEVILSDTQIKFDIAIDSLGLDYSGNGLSFTLDSQGNYNIDSVEIINPILLTDEVNLNKLYQNTISIDRINCQQLKSSTSIFRIIACIASDDIPTDEPSCSQLIISGGTNLSDSDFIEFENLYVDMPFGDCSECSDYILLPDKKIAGTNYRANKEIEIRGFIDKNQTVEFSICE